MTPRRGAALALLVASASLVPLSQASARCWRCGPGIFALPFVVAGAAVAGAAVATAPFYAVAPGPYYAPPPAYYYPPAAYYGPPGYYYSYNPRGYWAQGGAN
jgi:hypothetical protein